MRFAVFLPDGADGVPALYWLSGLTCTEENFVVKAGAQRLAAELGIALIVPDTSPRGVDIPGQDDRIDVGKSATRLTATARGGLTSAQQRALDARAQAWLRANAPEAASVREFLEQATGAAPQDGAGSGVEVLGPAPALMERRRDRSHAHLLARSTSRARLQEYLGRWIPAVRELKRPRRVSWSLDVDPAEIG
jgi:hypothetical protein